MNVWYDGNIPVFIDNNGLLWAFHHAGFTGDALPVGLDLDLSPVNYDGREVHEVLPEDHKKCIATYKLI